MQYDVAWCGYYINKKKKISNVSENFPVHWNVVIKKIGLVY